MLHTFPHLHTASKIKFAAYLFQFYLQLYESYFHKLYLILFNQFRPSVVPYIENSHLFCSAKQTTSFYMKCNTGLKWVPTPFSQFKLNKAKIYKNKDLPFSMKVWQHPPAWSCCSNTSTFFPAFAKIAAQDRPPIPLPITITSILFGTFFVLKPWCKKENEKISILNMTH